MVLALLSSLIILTIESLTQEILCRINFQRAIVPKIIHSCFLLNLELLALSFSYQFFIYLFVSLLIPLRWFLFHLLTLWSQFTLILKPVATSTATLIWPPCWTLIFQNSNNMLLILISVLQILIFGALLKIQFLPLGLTTLETFIQTRSVLLNRDYDIIGVDMVI